MRKESSQKGGLHVVEWCNTILGSTKLDVSVLFDAMKLVEVLEKQRKVSSSTLTLDPHLIAAMIKFSDDKERDPLDSNTDGEVDDDNIGMVGVPPNTTSCTSYITLEELLSLPSDIDDVVEEKQAGLK